MDKMLSIHKKYKVIHKFLKVYQTTIMIFLHKVRCRVLTTISFIYINRNYTRYNAIRNLSMINLCLSALTKRL